jgi:hypothetical protein
VKILPETLFRKLACFGFPIAAVTLKDVPKAPVSLKIFPKAGLEKLEKSYQSEIRKADK